MRLPAALLILVASVGAAACTDAVEARELSPFLLVGRAEMRPGEPFAALDEAANAEQRQRYLCEPVWGGARRCMLRVDPGILTVLVDPAGTIVRVVLITEESMRVPEHYSNRRAVLQNFLDASRMAWDSVGPVMVEELQDSVFEYRWQDARKRFSGTIWIAAAVKYVPPVIRSQLKMPLDSLAGVPDSVAVTDEVAYARLMADRPGGPPVRRRKLEPTTVATARSLASDPQQEAVRAMETALRQLASAQAQHRQARGRYARRLDALSLATPKGVGITLVDIGGAGWGAVAEHGAFPAGSCIVHDGAGHQLPRTRRDQLGAPSGHVICDRP